MAALPSTAQQSLTWQTYGSDADNLVAVTLCDFTTYGQYTFNPQGNFRQRGIVFATGVVIDNLLSSAPVTVMIGPLVETIPAYTKQVLQLGGTSAQVTVQSSQSRIYVSFFFGAYLGTTSGTNYYLAQLAAGLAVETGFIDMFAGQAAAIPVGYLLCDGAAVSRDTYKGLFAVIGTLYGPGDGSTTFNLPNMSSRVPIGAGTGQGLSTRALASTGGAENVVITAAMMPVHTHAVTDPGHAHAVSDPGHGHGITDPGHAHGVTDPGHGHGVQDPGHGHGLQELNPDGSGLRTVAMFSIQDVNVSRFGANNNNSAPGPYLIGHPTAYDTQAQQQSPFYNVRLAGAQTGIAIAGSVTGLTVNGAGTGITVKNGATGVTIQSAGTGITIGNAGGQNGTTQATPTLPPYTAVNFVIKT